MINKNLLHISRAIVLPVLFIHSFIYLFIKKDRIYEVYDNSVSKLYMHHNIRWIGITHCYCNKISRRVIRD